MPRYRFSWASLPPGLLRALKRDLDLDGDAPTALRKLYGARPRAAFVGEAWPILQESWLARDRLARVQVVDSLRARRLGNVTIETRTAQGQLNYLRSCRNSGTLRDVVVDALIAAGEPASKESLDEQSADASKPLSKAWPTFLTSLAESLAALSEDQYLILERKDRPWYVQFAAQGNFGMRSELVSNGYLEPDQQLPDSAIKTALSLGWLPPTDDPKSAAQHAGSDGSSNYFRDWEQPVPFGVVAKLAVDTLVEVLGVRHPGFLQYGAFAADGAKILLPVLGPGARPEAKVESTDAPASLEPDQIRGTLLDALRHASGQADLDFDEDGDIPLRYGSSMVFTRVLHDPPIVRVFSPVLGRVTESADVLDALNDLNERSFFTKWLLVDGTVVAVVELFGHPLATEHVVSACQVVGETVDGVDEQLQQRLGGKTYFGDYVQRKLPPNSGGYL